MDLVMRRENKSRITKPQIGIVIFDWGAIGRQQISDWRYQGENTEEGGGWFAILFYVPN